MSREAILVLAIAKGGLFALMMFKGCSVAKKGKAEAEAEKTRIAAQAEADANAMINSSITENLIRMKEAEARLKHGWVTVQGAQAVVTDK